MKWVLNVLNGPEAGRRFECSGNDIVLVGVAEHVHFRFQDTDPYMSGVHCLLELHPPRCLILDLESTNGTKVNGKKVPRTELHDGDVIELGKTRIKVEAIEEVPAPVQVDVLCVRCGKNVNQEIELLSGLSSEDWAVLVYLCRACQAAEEVKRREIKVRSQGLTCHCLDCQEDVTKKAKADGWAAEIQDIAHYLCRKCADNRDTRPVSDPRISDYRILTRLGAGGFGEVFSAWHEPTGRLVALKLMLPIVHEKEQRANAWFKREMAVAKELKHPNIVRLLDSGMHGGRHYFSSEFMMDGDLDTLVMKKFKGPVPPRAAVEYLLPALEAMEFVHQRGIVHRDIKPGNILITRPANGQGEIVKIGDLGMAKSFVEAGGSFLTDAGESRGTPLFMAPEQIRNYKYVGPTTDVYAIGVSLYYLLSGSFPFDFPSPLDILLSAGEEMVEKEIPLVYMILEGERIPIRKKSPYVPKALAEIVDKSVRRDVERRFQTAKELKDALRHALRSLE